MAKRKNKLTEFDHQPSSFLAAAIPKLRSDAENTNDPKTRRGIQKVIQYIKDILTLRG